MNTHIRINARILEAHQYNMSMLSGALVNIEEQVYQFLDILDELPPTQKEQIKKSFNERVTGIGSVCHCLSVIAEKTGDDFDEYAFWARETGTEISYQPN